MTPMICCLKSSRQPDPNHRCSDSRAFPEAVSSASSAAAAPLALLAPTPQRQHQGSTRCVCVGTEKTSTERHGSCSTSVRKIPGNGRNACLSAMVSGTAGRRLDNSKFDFAVLAPERPWSKAVFRKPPCCSADLLRSRGGCIRVETTLEPRL